MNHGVRVESCILQNTAAAGCVVNNHGAREAAPDNMLMWVFVWY